MRLLSLIVLSAIAVLGSDVSSGMAQGQPEKSWVEVKCERYKKAWDEALKRRGTTGISQEFISRHEVFLASGCIAQGDVCPRSTEEFDLANMMVVAAMNAGTASAFPPFSCRK
ncbi:hypothetical protein MHY87_11440 [Microvirga sp. ACRRW]|uniref:hypothetical protein n=1 Tax=Microvirga sp. ACRRW TaxID=2918205 RepID=UPI001EF50454|nr:hypothetical protein [Microvirga sp. ACRRW]MCG7393520.1 hypothetical protein [Microvirga sp. ACRRW]